MYDSDGPLEYGGPSMEYYLKHNLSLGISGSWNGDENYLSQVIIDEKSGANGAYDYHLIEKNRIVNVYFRKYARDSTGTGFYYGGYIRYWYYRNERLETDLYPPEYKNYFVVNNYPVTYVDHKISLGFLVGFKGKIYKGITWGVTLGTGFSPKFLYLSYEKHFDPGKNGIRRYSNSFSLEHLNILCHIFLGYRF